MRDSLLQAHTIQTYPFQFIFWRDQMDQTKPVNNYFSSSKKNFEWRESVLGYWTKVQLSHERFSIPGWPSQDDHSGKLTQSSSRACFTDRNKEFSQAQILFWFSDSKIFLQFIDFSPWRKEKIFPDFSALWQGWKKPQICSGSQILGVSSQNAIFEEFGSQIMEIFSPVFF